MRHTVVLLTIGALLVATAACGSEGSGDSFGIGQPTTADAPAASTPTSTRGATEPSTPVGSTATPPPVATPSPTSSTTPGPLPEPVVSLVDVGSFDQPVDVVARAGDATAYVVEQPGRVVAATAQSNEPVLDITDLTDAEGERGLLGLAFHPTDALAYIHFTDLSGDTVVAELAVDPTTGQFDRNSLREVLTVDQPFTNHNGGRIVFGPDGYLYIGLGDGGSGGDPERNSLDLASRLGKILRIDPVEADGQPFTVPADNPFVDVAGADPTIWSFGLRNPWKFSFDDDERRSVDRRRRPERVRGDQPVGRDRPTRRRQGRQLRLERVRGLRTLQRRPTCRRRSATAVRVRPRRRTLLGHRWQRRSRGERRRPGRLVRVRRLLQRPDLGARPNSAAQRAPGGRDRPTLDTRRHR